MKSNILRFGILTIVLLCSIGCKKDYLDKQPDDMLTMDQVFSNRKQTESYLANVYSYLPDDPNLLNYNWWIGGSDEADFVYSWPQSNLINQGSFSAISPVADLWGPLYRAIRSATVFINRVDENPELTPQLKSEYKAEARFLRAYYYFLLLRQYGPLIILGDQVIPVDAEVANLQLPRNSYDECVNFLAAELDESATYLPLDRTVDPSFRAKPERGVAMALKSRILLYAASPLFNGNTDYNGFKNKDGKQLINTTYDASKWGRAAKAAKDLINLAEGGKYALYKKLDGSGKIDPIASYRDLFIEKWNSEVIFARTNNGLWEWERICSPRQVQGGAANGTAVTQQQVDAYQMNNGKMKDEAGSGYVEEGFSTTDEGYTKKGTWNMYTKREPRFYVSVAYNGAEWVFKKRGTVKVEMYFSGSSGKGASLNFSSTGYLVMKNVSPNTDILQGIRDTRPFVTFRLGEVYLNYAEALNESDPGNPDILKYVNMIRERGGIPDLPSTLSQSELRERIRNERRVELAFENHRYFDTRRWKIAEQTDRGAMWGMNIDNGTSFTDASFFKRTIFENRVFEKRHYLLPITQYETDRNKNLTQNPGY